MALIDVIAGARPNFVKIASVVAALDRHRAAGGHLRYRLVHTGQHTDRAMSADFFRELNIPEPHVHLGAAAGSQAQQTGAIMSGYEALLRDSASSCCLVVGDVTSTMACAITAQKSGIPVAHVEGGLRSGDWSMPEEINRLVTDAITNWFFTTSEAAGANLRAGGVGTERIFFVGNTMIDTLLANLDRLEAPDFGTELGLQQQGYFVLTLHRPSNVDEPGRLGALLRNVAQNARGLPVIFAVHPRTAAVLAKAGPLPPGVHCVPPQPYLSFNHLVRHARAVITDSGGISEETTALGVPCMTLRTTTERPETVAVGTNEVVGVDPAALADAFERLFAGWWKVGSIPPLWDGKAGSRIVEVLARLLPVPA